MYTYDNFGRETGTSLLDGSDPVTFSYDSTGLILTSTFADGSTNQVIVGIGGTPLEETDALGDKTNYRYTPDGLLTSVIGPLGGIIKQSYTNGFLTGGVSASGTTGASTYDSLGLLTALTDGNGNVVGMSYNSNRQLTRVTYPDQTTEQYTFNGLGQVSQLTQRDGSTITNTYDALGDLTHGAFSTGASDTYTYDARGNLLTATGPNGTTTLYLRLGQPGHQHHRSLRTSASHLCLQRQWHACDRFRSDRRRHPVYV